MNGDRMFSPLSLTDKVRGSGVGCAGEKGELLKVSGENEQLQAFLKVIWCKLHLDAVAKEEQVGVLVMEIIKSQSK